MDIDPEKLRPYTNYLWWETPEDAINRPVRLLAQIMEMGETRDVYTLLSSIGEEPFKEALVYAPAGVFSLKQWRRWHYWLGIAKSDADIPPLPQRTFEDTNE